MKPVKPKESHSGGIQDPRSKIAGRSFPVILDPEPRPNEFHSVSFGFIRGRSWIQDCWEVFPSKLWIQDLPRMKPVKPKESHSGGIQDPRSKIAGRSFPVILDPEPRPNEFHSVSFGFIRGRSWTQD